MHRVAFFFFLIATLAVAQTAKSTASKAPTQTARQALIEMISSGSPDAVQKHLMNNTLAAIDKLGDSAKMTMGLAMMAGTRPGLETFNSGPILLRYVDPKTHERVDVVVEKDEATADREELSLGLRMFLKEGNKPSNLFPQFPVSPTFGVIMQREEGIWKIAHLSVTLNLPIADQAFLDSVVKQSLIQQQQQSENAVKYALKQLAQDNVLYAQDHGEATCDLEALGSSYYLAQARRGYTISISGCSGGNFDITAVPVVKDAGMRAYCTDQSAEVRYSADGQAASCLQSGTSVSADSQ